MLLALGVITVAFVMLSQTVFQNLSTTTKIRGRDAVSQIEDAIRDWIAVQIGDFLETADTRCDGNPQTGVIWQPTSDNDPSWPYASDQFNVAYVGFNAASSWDEETAADAPQEFKDARDRCNANQTTAIVGGTTRVYLCFALTTPGPGGQYPPVGSVLPPQPTVENPTHPPVFIEMNYQLWNFDDAVNGNCTSLYNHLDANGEPDNLPYARGGNVVYTIYYRTKSAGGKTNYHQRTGNFFIKSHD